MLTSQLAYCSFIQSTYGKNFEALIIHPQSGKLQHWYKINTIVPLLPGQNPGWNSTGDIAMPGNRTVAGAAALIQGSFGQGYGHNLETLAPLYAAGNSGRAELWHLWRDDENGKVWKSGQRVTGENDDVAYPVSFIQSSFRTGAHGNFEVVVPLKTAAGGVELWHFWHDNSNPALPWRKGQRITAAADAVAGSACIIQSSFRSGAHGNFEVVVPLRSAGGATELWHYWKDCSNAASPWQRGMRITPDGVRAMGHAIMIQSSFRSGAHGNFELVAPVITGNNKTELRHFWHDNSNMGSAWKTGQLISASASGAGGFFQGMLGDGNHKNFEVLAQECTQSMVDYTHVNSNVQWPWLREELVTGEPSLPVNTYTAKVIQLTGADDRDRTYWNGQGQPPAAHNRAACAAVKLKGTDLGASFRHNDKVYFLFGDTVGTDNSSPFQNGLDSIAWTRDTAAGNGIDLTFNNRPPDIAGAINQGGFNVPLDGFSENDNMYVFFSAGHYTIPRSKNRHFDVMGRSLLARSTDGGCRFTALGDVSSDKFINISCVYDPAARVELDNRMYAGGIWVWGSGRYRSSDVYLGFIPWPVTVLGGRVCMFFYSGSSLSMQPLWSNNETDARPLFCSGNVGELSVRYNRFLSRWLITYQSDNPRGIHLRMAATPWGRWSDVQLIFNPGQGRGYRRFMHEAKFDDCLNDDMFGNRYDVWGGEYGAYQLGDYAEGETGIYTKIYFTLSTWNPYQVMLMHTLIAAPGNENALNSRLLLRK